MLNENRLRLFTLGSGFIFLVPIALWLFAMGIGGVCSACSGFCGHLF